jgi:aldehyde dehydrogenase (NAD+)
MTTKATKRTVSNNYQELFDLQKANQYNVGNTTASERKAKLKALKYALEVEFRNKIREASRQDLGKASAEADLTEVFPAVSEAKHAIRHLKSWIKPHKVSTPLSLLGATSWIKYEPKGVCLIISPWNFPFNLTFGPLISAIAAGNTVIIKPSEMTPNCSAVMREIVAKLFKEDEVALIEGGVETSTALLNLPFNHIFFTGAPSIGKIVMTAAAQHLTSVTLELGGKSPTIVDETAHINSAVKRIAWGKFANNGQVCIAPDYVFVHESKKQEFTKALQNQLVEFYGEEPEKSESFARIVNERHFDRLKGYLDDAVKKGAKILTGGQGVRKEKFLAPTIVEDASLDSELMTNEIFGPVLPVFSYKNLDEPIQYIQKNEKPLALYIYSKDPNNISKILDNTRAGGTCINHNDLHFFNNNLPFGGVNNSGIGKGHGKFGFEAFSNARGIMRQHIPGALELLMPPYNDFKRRMIELTIKWF